MCELCREYHAVEMSFGFDAPDPYASLKSEEREIRAMLNRNECVIDDKWFFVRGYLEVPVIGTNEAFLWGLWANVFERDFHEIHTTWDRTQPGGPFGRYKCRIANSIEEYPDSFNLKVSLEVQAVGQRPRLRVDEAQHALALDQQNGITPERAISLASSVSHRQGVRHARKM